MEVANSVELECLDTVSPVDSLNPETSFLFTKTLKISLLWTAASHRIRFDTAANVRSDTKGTP
jgi:hypothetical protein